MKNTTQKGFEWVVTTEHPVRYVAQDVFPACAELDERLHNSEQAQCWTEAGYYWHAIKNTSFSDSNIVDGIYAHIYMKHDQKLAKKHPKYRQIVGYSVEASTYLPNALRLQRHWSNHHVVDFASAKMVMVQSLEKAYVWKERMLKETEGLKRSIHWGQREGEYILSSIGMTFFLREILPNESGLREILTENDQGTFCPADQFSKLQAVLRKHHVYGQIVGW